MSQSRDGVIHSQVPHTAISHYPLDIPEIVWHIISFLAATPQHIIALSRTNRFFNQQAMAYLLNDPDYLHKGITTLEKEIKMAIKVVLPSLSASPCRLYDVLYELPPHIVLHDELIQTVKNIAMRNKAILSMVKYGHSAFMSVPAASVVLSVLSFIVGCTSLALEFVIFAMIIAATFFYLDKYMVNNGVRRENLIPTRENFLHTPSVDILFKKYSQLEKLCQAWLQLGDKIKKEYSQRDPVFLYTEDEKIKDHLLAKLTRRY